MDWKYKLAKPFFIKDTQISKVSLVYDHDAKVYDLARFTPKSA